MAGAACCASNGDLGTRSCSLIRYLRRGNAPKVPVDDVGVRGNFWCLQKVAHVQDGTLMEDGANDKVKYLRILIL